LAALGGERMLPAGSGRKGATMPLVNVEMIEGRTQAPARP